MSPQMRIGLGQFNELTDEKLAFIKQLGADDFLMNTPRLPGEKQWEYEDLKAASDRAKAAGLRLICLENVPVSFYDKAMLGLPGTRRADRSYADDSSEYGASRDSDSRLPLDAQLGLAHSGPGAAAGRSARHPIQFGGA